jgi:hypothetical protein
MAIRWYAMALAVQGNYRGPKYLRWRMNPTGLDVPWAMQDYGLMPVAVLWADVSTTQHNGLIANADCRHIVLHANVDDTVGSAVTGTRAALEALQIPGNWVQSADAWRTVLRTVIGVFQYAQRLHGKFGVPIVPDGYSLDSTWQEIPAQGQQFLLDTAAELGIDTSGVTGTVTLRQIYRTFGDVWANRVVHMGTVEL